MPQTWYCHLQQPTHKQHKNLKNQEISLKKLCNRKEGIHICLPVHCLSAMPGRQPYCHTNAASQSFIDKTRPTHATIACQYIVGAWCSGVMVLSSCVSVYEHGKWIRLYTFAHTQVCVHTYTFHDVHARTWTSRWKHNIARKNLKLTDHHRHDVPCFNICWHNQWDMTYILGGTFLDFGNVTTPSQIVFISCGKDTSFNEICSFNQVGLLKNNNATCIFAKPQQTNSYLPMRKLAKEKTKYVFQKKV